MTFYRFRKPDDQGLFWNGTANIDTGKLNYNGLGEIFASAEETCKKRDLFLAASIDDVVLQEISIEVHNEVDYSVDEDNKDTNLVKREIIRRGYGFHFADTFKIDVCCYFKVTTRASVVSMARDFENSGMDFHIIPEAGSGGVWFGIYGEHDTMVLRLKYPELEFLYVKGILKNHGH